MTFAAESSATPGCLIAAVASMLRGGNYRHAEEPTLAPSGPGQIPQLEKSHARF